MDALAPGALLTFARDELRRHVNEATAAIRLASPFLSRPVAAEVGAAARASRASDRRLLTALTPRSVITGALSARGLALMLGAGFEIRSIPNLHAKLSLVDARWGLTGSGNLTGSGLGGEGSGRGNLELGVRLSPRQIELATALYDEWWDSAALGRVTPDLLAPFLRIKPVRPKVPRGLAAVGVALPPPPRVDARPAPRQYWIKAMYGLGKADGQWWLRRPWIHDHHRGTRERITFRPRYRVGDLVALYVTQPRGPGRVPAVLEVTGEPYDGRKEVETAYGKDEAARYGWVTPITVIRTVSIDQAPGIEVLGLDPKGLQNGRAVADPRRFRDLERLIPPVR